MAKLYWRIKDQGKWTWKAVIWLDNEKECIKELISEHKILPIEVE